MDVWIFVVNGCHAVHKSRADRRGSSMPVLFPVAIASAIVRFRRLAGGGFGQPEDTRSARVSIAAALLKSFSPGPVLYALNVVGPRASASTTGPNLLVRPPDVSYRSLEIERNLCAWNPQSKTSACQQSLRRPNSDQMTPCGAARPHQGLAPDVVWSETVLY